MLKNPFKKLNTLELCLWIFSLVLVILSFVLSPLKDYLTLVASLIGVTALIFVAKGMVIGQILTVVFSVFYGIISFFFAYYCEMITYLLMTAPIAILATVEWIKNPYKKTETVAIKKLTAKDIIIMVALCIIVTVAFYFILKAFNTANLVFSTISVTTSFFACYLTYLRSPYYALAYACNDIILIVLWVLATIENVAYIPMIVCFSTFLLNDLYGFFNWSKMQKKQSKNL
jgi:nicotinamide mononucleotide transporter PnuC